MRSSIVLLVALIGCMEDDGESCFDKYPNGKPADPWREPRHVTLMSSTDHPQTLSRTCTQTDFDESCVSQDRCYCDFLMKTNYVTTNIPCSYTDECMGIDEATCPNTAGCWVVRNSDTNAFIDCYHAGIPTLNTPCSMLATAEACGDGFNCAGLYASAGPGTWVFIACGDL